MGRKKSCQKKYKNSMYNHERPCRSKPTHFAESIARYGVGIESNKVKRNYEKKGSFKGGEVMSEEREEGK